MSSLWFNKKTSPNPHKIIYFFLHWEQKKKKKKKKLPWGLLAVLSLSEAKDGV
jgi:hypothetical protein